ncbi:MAG: tetratricopeptide repeat-containing protein [Cyanothece sp. SIO2G6]|nr:tetratricopeptide repeat-containing protein [Cyanothece sp. SIO2G6]
MNTHRSNPPDATPEAKAFLRDLVQRIEQNRDDPEPIYAHFKTNLDQLDEVLLHAIPVVFAELIQPQQSGLGRWLGWLQRLWSSQLSQQQWQIGAIFNILGNRFSEFPLGNRAFNLELSIAAYEAALQVRTREAFPEKWAMTQNNLGIAYSNRIRGDRAENLEKAIALYESALQVYTRETFPQDWVATQGNLVSALVQQSQLTQNIQDLDAAITALRETLSFTIPGTDYYVNNHYFLGIALDYRYSLHGQSTDLEQAIAAYTCAAESTPWPDKKLDYQQKAADSQYQLGIALTQSGEWYNGLNHLQAALEGYRTVNNRAAKANALQQMARSHYLLGNFDKALLYFRDALRLYQAEANLPGEAHCRTGLGRLLLRLNFLAKAIPHLAKAKELYTQLDNQPRLEEVEKVYALAQKIQAKQPLR